MFGEYSRKGITSGALADMGGNAVSIVVCHAIHFAMVHSLGDIL
jgi:hypothetical protein